MSDIDAEDEETTPAEPVKVKQVAIAAGLVSAALAAAVAFTVAGPLGVGVAAAGVAGTGYAAHRIRNPKTNRPGVLHSWLTRTRKTKTTGALTWPFTGSQSRRALLKSGGTGSGKRGGRLGTGRSAGRMTPGSGARRGSLLPATTRSRATRSAGGALPTRATGSRRLSTTRTPAPGRTPFAGRSALRPKPNRPVTATRTPAKASKATPLTSGTRGRRPGPTTKPLSLTNSKSRHRPSGSRSRTPGTFSGLRRGGRPGSVPRRSGSGRFNPWRSTRGGQSLGTRSRDTRRTRRANRLGGTQTTVPRRGLLGRMRHRVTPDRNRNTAPNRTKLRPRPYSRRTAGQLLRTSLRLPERRRTTRGSRRVIAPFRRPSKRQAKRARRTLRLRSSVRLRHSLRWLASTPARRWDRLWERLPMAPLPLTHYTEPAGMKVSTGPKHETPKTRPTEPQPFPPYVPATPSDIDLMPIKHNGELIYVSNPNEQIMEAFQAMAGFEPQSAVEAEQWLVGQVEMWKSVHGAYVLLAERMRDSMPFAGPVAEAVHEIGAAAGAVSGVAQAGHHTMRAAHTADFQRIEEPRPGEDLWNPEKNR